MSLVISDYTDRSIAVRGNRDKYKKQMLSFGGRWNAKVQGWLVPKERKSDIEKLNKESKKSGSRKSDRESESHKSDKGSHDSDRGSRKSDKGSRESDKGSRDSRKSDKGSRESDKGSHDSRKSDKGSRESDRGSRKSDRKSKESSKNYKKSEEKRLDDFDSDEEDVISLCHKYKQLRLEFNELKKKLGK